jgi:hypothetical protein
MVNCIFLVFRADVRKIIPADILPDSLASGIARVANLKNSKVVTSPTGKKVGKSLIVLHIHIVHSVVNLFCFCERNWFLGGSNSSR